MRLNAHLLYALFKHTFKTGMKNKGIGKIYLLAKRIAVGEMPNINGSIEQVNIWNNSKITTGVITTESKGTKLPSSASENATGCKISINFGNGEYHNNLQPSKAVYRFKRTA